MICSRCARELDDLGNDADDSPYCEGRTSFAARIEHDPIKEN
jgi:hypothetical protein